MQGDSAGHLPNQVKIKKLETKSQNIKRERGELKNPLKIKLDEEKEKKKRTSTASNKPNTPPNLLGIERRIA